MAKTHRAASPSHLARSKRVETGVVDALATFLDELAAPIARLDPDVAAKLRRGAARARALRARAHELRDELAPLARRAREAIEQGKAKQKGRAR